jgi:MerR family transcriptional regulator, thiopeptide resistance regulator
VGSMTEMARAETALTVGQVAERFDVTVRTLHHYDEVGLLRPSRRSAAGYRLYTDDDLVRLQHVVVYRRLGFALEEIALLLDDPDADVGEHLRRQRAAVMSRLDEMHDLVTAIDRALEAEMSGMQLTPEEQRELFGEGFSEEYATEAEERWGDTDAWRQSQQRTARYTRTDWEAIKAEGDAVNAAFVAALRAGEPPTSPRTRDAAEAHRRHIHDRFYDLGPEMHRALADMYVADPRFTKTYEDLEPGLAQYVHDAIHGLYGT